MTLGHSINFIFFIWTFQFINYFEQIHKKRHHDKLEDNSSPNQKHRELRTDLSQTYIQIDQSSGHGLNQIESDLKQLNSTLLNRNMIYTETNVARRSVSVESTSSQKRSSPSSKRGRYQTQSENSSKINIDFELKNKAIQSLKNVEFPNDMMSNLNLKSSSEKLLLREDLKDLIIISSVDLANNLRQIDIEKQQSNKLRKLSPDRCMVLNQQLTDAENKLLGLANIALEREGN